MKNVLIILNYQREIPPFMLSEIRIAKDKFDKIYYISRRLLNRNTEYISFPNVEIIQVSNTLRSLLFLISPILSFFSIDFWRKIGSMNLGFIKYGLVTDFLSNNLYYTACKVLKKVDRKQNNIYILSTWFASEAFAAAKLKRRYKPNKAISLAHSFEIDPAKNPYTSDIKNEYKHKNLDCVFFISERMRQIYFEATNKYDFERKYSKNCKTTYLGCIKQEKGMNKPSHDGTFRVLSCSGAISVKRITLIIHALKQIVSKKIIWTHIGDGPLLDSIKQEAKANLDSCDNIQYEFLGRLKNSQIHEYYTSHPVDVFVNVSSSEGLPVSLMEAIAYGVPCIATDVGGTRELVNSKTGFLLNANPTFDQIASAILSFINMSDKEINVIRNDAFSKWRSSFDSIKNVNDFLNQIIE